MTEIKFQAYSVQGSNFTIYEISKTLQYPINKYANTAGIYAKDYTSDLIIFKDTLQHIVKHQKQQLRLTNSSALSIHVKNIHVAHCVVLVNLKFL